MARGLVPSQFDEIYLLIFPLQTRKHPKETVFWFGILIYDVLLNIFTVKKAII